MASTRTKYTVGVFIVSGVTVAVLAVIWLGVSRFFEKGRFYVTYFNESVQGLDKDAPVKYRGVPIGRVERIGVAPDSNLIEVVLKIDTTEEMGADVVTQLKAVGITGSVFIEVDRKREGEPDRSPAITFAAPYPLLASKPSGMTYLFTVVEETLSYLKALDIAAISTKVQMALDTMNKTMADADIKGLSDAATTSFATINTVLEKKRLDRLMVSLEETAQALPLVLADAQKGMQRLDGLASRVDGFWQDQEPTFKAVLADLDQALVNAKALTENGATLADRTDQRLQSLQRSLLVTGQNLERITLNLNALMEVLSYQPSQLLRGSPPAPRPVEPMTAEPQ